jgi:hypothetical protein
MSHVASGWAHRAVTTTLLNLFVRSQWVGYMKVCLENPRRHFDPRSPNEETTSH